MIEVPTFLLRVAQWIAGEDRREWIDAMMAEADTLGSGGLDWAMGCLWAALKDRLRRERMSLALVVAVPIVGAGFQFLTFFPTVWLVRHAGVPNWIFYLIAIFSPLPFVWLFGRWCSHVAMPAAFVSFLISALLPGFIFWLSFGASPWLFFGEGATLYGMPVKVGLCVSLALWLIAAKLASRSLGRV